MELFISSIHTFSIFFFLEHLIKIYQESLKQKIVSWRPHYGFWMQKDHQQSKFQPPVIKGGGLILMCPVPACIAQIVNMLRPKSNLPKGGHSSFYVLSCICSAQTCISIGIYVSQYHNPIALLTDWEYRWLLLYFQHKNECQSLQHFT